MCSIQDAFPDLSFNKKINIENTGNQTDMNIKKSKNDMIQLQKERGDMISFQNSSNTSPYNIPNKTNIPYISNTNISDEYKLDNNLNKINSDSTITSNEQTNKISNNKKNKNDNTNNINYLVLLKKMNKFEDKIKKLENKINRKSHDMILFIVIIIFIILIIDTLLH